MQVLNRHKPTAASHQYYKNINITLANQEVKLVQNLTCQNCEVGKCMNLDLRVKKTREFSSQLKRSRVFPPTFFHCKLTFWPQVVKQEYKFIHNSCQFQHDSTTRLYTCSTIYNVTMQWMQHWMKLVVKVNDTSFLFPLLSLHFNSTRIQTFPCSDKKVINIYFFSTLV